MKLTTWYLALTMVALACDINPSANDVLVPADTAATAAATMPPADTARWLFLYKVADGAAFLDSQSIVPGDSGKVTAWTKITIADDTLSLDANQKTKWHAALRFDCPERQYTFAATVDSTDAYETFPEAWVLVQPESGYETMLDVACLAADDLPAARSMVRNNILADLRALEEASRILDEAIKGGAR